jgi:hypothetical protein
MACEDFGGFELGSFASDGFVSGTAHPTSTAQKHLDNSGNGGGTSVNGFGNTANPVAYRLVNTTMRNLNEFWLRYHITHNNLGGNRVSKWAWINGVTELGSIRLFSENGVIQIYTGTASLQASSPADSFPPNVWFMVELHVRIHGTDGLIEVFIDDNGSYSSPAVSFSGDTTPDANTEITTVGYGSAAENYMDDWQVNSITLNYDGGGGTFAPSQGDTITDGTSGATAKVWTDEGDGTSGILVLYDWNGLAFGNNNTITESGGLTTALVNAPDASYENGFEPNSAAPREGFVVALSPIGNGTTTQLDGSDGDSIDNYQLVDENPFSDADYVLSGVADEYDTYDMDTLPISAVGVNAIKSVMRVSRDGTTVNNFQSVVRVGGTDYDSASQALPTSFDYRSNVWNTSPNTDTKWTTAEINSMEAGFKVKA